MVGRLGAPAAGLWHVRPIGSTGDCMFETALSLDALDGVLAGELVAATEHDGPPEYRLVKRAMSGERGAFGQLYQRHVDAVFNYLYFRVRDVGLAEDLAQDTFVRAYKGISRLRRPERFEAWLMRIAHNRVLNHWREQAARPETVGGSVMADEAAATAAATDALAPLEHRLAAEAVLRAAAELTDLQHQVIALRFVSGLSVAETATVMGRSVNAVKNLQHHALAGLRRHLGTREARS